jgi:iron-sulfur cluster assembly accessory protein
MAINSGKDFVWFGVEGGGCSGFNYKWEFVEDPDPDDYKISLGSTMHGTQHREMFLIVDLISEMHIMGSEIDYVQELGGSFLKVNNPIAASSCGCGESFSI